MKWTFIKKGYRELWAHKFKYFFIILVLGLGIATYGSMYDMASTRGATLGAIYEESNFMDMEVTLKYGTAVNMSTMQTILARPEIASDVESVEYRLIYDIFINMTKGSEVETKRGMVMGYVAFDDLGQENEPEVNTPLYYVDNPNWFSNNNADECFIEHKFGRAHGLDRNDQVTLVKGTETVKVDIVHHANIPEHFYVIPEGSFIPAEGDLGICMLPIETANRLLYGTLGTELMYNDFVVTYVDGVDTEDFRTKIEAAFAELELPVETTDKEENAARRFLYDDYENDKQNVATFPIVVFTVSAFALIITLRRMIRTHRGQIGIFKSLGIPNSTVMLYFGIIGAMLAALSVLMGIILSIPMRVGFIALINSMLAFALTKETIAFEHYVGACAFAIVLCLACTLIPAWFALRIKPVDAIQQKEGINVTKAGRISSKLAKSKKMPVPIKLAIRNTFRKPGRSLTTVLGVALSLSLFLGFAVMMDSVLVVIDEMNAGNAWDYEVMMDGFQPMNATAHWEDDFLEIEDVNPGIMMPTLVSSGDKEEGVFIYAVQNMDTSFHVNVGRGSLDDGGVVISAFVSEKMGLGPGDNIDILLPSLNFTSGGITMETMSVPVSGVQDNLMGYYFFMELPTMQSLTGLYGLANIYYLQVEDGKAVQHLENSLITTPGVAGVTHVKERENVLDDYMEIFIGTVLIMVLVSIILASAIVYNLFLIDAEERKRDYATMKTVGTSIPKLAILQFLEAGFVTVGGIVMGTLAGYGLAFMMLQVAGEWEIMNMRIMFSAPATITGAGIIIFVVTAVCLITIRYIAKIDIANEIRERTQG